MRKTLLSILVLLTVYPAIAQKNFWTEVKESAFNTDIFEGRFKPASFKLFQLNEQLFVTDVLQAPLDRLVPVSASSFLISVPNAEGYMETFKVVEAPVMDAALSSRYPNIRSYAGVSESSAIRFDISPQGIHAMITSADKPTVYIDPVQRSSNTYVVFSRRDVMEFRKHFSCGTDVNGVRDITENIDLPRLGADDGKLRTYRLALASTGEYSQYFLDGTETSDVQRKGKVLAAMNTMMTRTNQIYERDFGVRMVLVANNDAIIYLTASTDPWTSEYNTKTQQTIDAVIGNANYDIGHLVHRGSNNGNAGCIGCVCRTGSKGSAFTSHTSPLGDPFVVDYVTHEMGHQFGGNHTFTHGNEGTGVQVEPGSGSTIMGYAGITGSTTDVQPHSDDYFHSKSIEQVTNYIKSSTGGAACPVVTVTGNSAPVVNAGSDYTIPKSTPFSLTGTASDVNPSNVLQYNWEQIDSRASGFSTVPSATATAGPQFRSYNYTTSLSRTIPQLSYILTGANGHRWEVLPSVGRILNFRFIARDNNTGGGNNNTDDMRVTIATSGPFAVTAPNTAVTWTTGSSQSVTWSVNNTTAAPVSCANVKISLSTDGGLTFPTVLIASTPNDGTEQITVPTVNSTTCRIKIEAVGNIFFDISNVNFTINGSAPACSNPTGLSVSGITNTSAVVSWTAVSSALSYDVDYKLSTSGTWISSISGTTSLSRTIGSLVQGNNYDWRVRANCASASSSYSTGQFTTSSPSTCGTVTGLSSSAITSGSAVVQWTALSGAVSYAVDYKTAASSIWISLATATTSTSQNLSGLTASTVYNWRVRANCNGATGIYSNGQFTTLQAQSGCVNAYESNETQATAASIPVNTVISAAISTATDVDYYKVTTTATSNFVVTLQNLPGDYELVMYNSAGTQIGSSTAGGTSNETISLANRAAGTYFIRVYGYNGASSSTVCYNLNVGTSTVTGCQSTYDNSTNGTISGAATIPFNTDIKGLISPSGDIDLYKFVITTGGTVTLTLGTLPADYDLRLLNSAGTQLAISQAGGTGSETINYTAAPGTYYARVYGYNNANNAASCYTLKVQTGTAGKPTGDEYRTEYITVFPNPATNFINVSVTSDTKEISLLQIYDIHGRVVLKANVINGINKLDISPLIKGTYMIRMNGIMGGHNTKFIKQ